MFPFVVRTLARLAALGALSVAALAAPEPHFAKRAEATSYLSHALPKATAANPKYLTAATGVLSQWLTENISFAGATVTMRERFSQTKEGATTRGLHEASFSLREVTIAAFTEPGDVTPDGRPAEGLLFTCAKPGCVAAKWGGKPSRADKTDIYIADETTRARILAAFHRLQSE